MKIRNEDTSQTLEITLDLSHQNMRLRKQLLKASLIYIRHHQENQDKN